MKSAKPNKSQCEEMKRRLLTALAIRKRPETHVWWGMPYNPYGDIATYSHPYPRRYFDFAAEVKAGAAFWAFVGDDNDTYDELLTIYLDVGRRYEERVEQLRQDIAAAQVSVSE